MRVSFKRPGRWPKRSQRPVSYMAVSEELEVNGRVRMSPVGQLTSIDALGFILRETLAVVRGL